MNAGVLGNIAPARLARQTARNAVFIASTIIFRTLVHHHHAVTEFTATDIVRAAVHAHHQAARPQAQAVHLAAEPVTVIMNAEDNGNTAPARPVHRTAPSAVFIALTTTSPTVVPQNHAATEFTATDTVRAAAHVHHQAQAAHRVADQAMQLTNTTIAMTPLSASKPAI